LGKILTYGYSSEEDYGFEIVEDWEKFFRDCLELFASDDFTSVFRGDVKEAKLTVRVINYSNLPEYVKEEAKRILEEEKMDSDLSNYLIIEVESRFDGSFQGTWIFAPKKEVYKLWGEEYQP